jgi:hypothetical protein
MFCCLVYSGAISKNILKRLEIKYVSKNFESDLENKLSHLKTKCAAPMNRRLLNLRCRVHYGYQVPHPENTAIYA